MDKRHSMYIKTFIIPNDARYYKNYRMLKQFKKL